MEVLRISNITICNLIKRIRMVRVSLNLSLDFSRSCRYNTSNSIFSVDYTRVDVVFVEIEIGVFSRKVSPVVFTNFKQHFLDYIIICTTNSRFLQMNYLIPVNINNQLAKKNQAVLHTQLYNKLAKNSRPVYVKVKDYILTCISSPDIPTQKIGLSKKIRDYLSVSMVEKVEVQPYIVPFDKQTGLSFVEIEVQFQNAIPNNIEIDDNKLEELLRQSMKEFFFKVNQSFYLTFEAYLIVGIVKKTELLMTGTKEIKKQPQGRLVPQTQVSFITKLGDKLQLKKDKNKGNSLFRPDFKIQQMGIGGLDDQLTNIFRRAFASRRYPQSVIQKFGIKHIKGVLLYGPPGTGKTLIARQLGKSLKAKQLTIVNGPEIFSKYVGQSEQNIRKLFKGAREDQQMFGDQSPLHIIVFDEIDAICKQRGTVTSGSNAQDLVVNQLLTNIDGVQSLNNILVIGMTNRKDLIDEAVLRPGRFQVHIEVGLPTTSGRQQILKIHTKSLEKNGILDTSVNLAQLAELTNNFTGAQIEALVKSASSFSMTRSHDIMNFGKQMVINEDVKVEREDFLKALTDVKPQFGVDQEKFDVFLRGKLYDYGPRYRKIIQTLDHAVQITKNGVSSQLNSVLIEGQPQTGKTSIAAYFGKKCSFAYVKLISPQNFVGFTQSGKINAIVKIFEDAYRSKEACIIIDNIQRIIEFIDIGPRFNNNLLQTLLVLIKKLPKKSDCRLLLIGTTSSYGLLQNLQIPQAFNQKLSVPQLSNQQLKYLLTNYFKKSQKQASQISKIFQYIPIKRFLQIKDMAGKGGISEWKEAWGMFYESQ